MIDLEQNSKQLCIAYPQLGIIRVVWYNKVPDCGHKTSES